MEKGGEMSELYSFSAIRGGKQTSKPETGKPCLVETLDCF